jgi:hypothetical protein
MHSVRPVTLDQASPFLQEQAHAVRVDDPFSARGRSILDKDYELATNAKADRESSRIGIAELLERNNHLATGRGSHSSEVASHAFEVARSDPGL